MSQPTHLVFPSVERYAAYLKSAGSDVDKQRELSVKMAVQVEGLYTKSYNDGADWTTVGIGHSLSHGGKWVFENAGVDWNKFKSTGVLSKEDAAKLYINGDNKRFRAIAEKHLGKEWFAEQPQNFQDAVILEIFNKGEVGFFHKAKPTQGYEKEVDQQKIEKLKSGDAKQIFEAFTTGQSVSGSTKLLKGGKGDTVRERLAPRRPFSGALAIAHLTEKPGVVPVEFMEAMVNDPLLSSMNREEILARTVKYANSRSQLKMEGMEIPDFTPSDPTVFEYEGRRFSTKAEADKERYNARQREHFLDDISDLPLEAQLLLVIVAALMQIIGKETFSEFMERFDAAPQPERERAIERLPEEHKRDFRPSASTGAAPGYNTPTGGIARFNYDLLSDRFEKSKVYPVEGATDRVITSDFGQRNLGYGSRNHPAYDLRAAAGMGVLSIFDGQVVKVGQMGVTVRNDNGTTTTYLHVDSKVSVGDRVKAGEKVATILPKCSRSPYNPHLDIRTMDSKSGIYINPSQYLDLDSMGVKFKSGAKASRESVLCDKDRGVFFDQQFINQRRGEKTDAVEQATTATINYEGLNSFLRDNGREEVPEEVQVIAHNAINPKSVENNAVKEKQVEAAAKKASQSVQLA